MGHVPTLTPRLFHSCLVFFLGECSTLETEGVLWIEEPHLFTVSTGLMSTNLGTHLGNRVSLYLSWYTFLLNVKPF